MWSISIYRGPSPIALRPHPGVRHPALRGRDVHPTEAELVADPFVVRHGGGLTMFFEVRWRADRRGEIGYASSADGRRWRYRGIALREPFHLSYPCVFHWRGGWYMVPETLAAEHVRLYRATRFPIGWERVTDLVGGSFADPSIVRFAGRFWLFACSTPYRHDTLRLFHAAELAGPWREHPQSPLVEGDPARARPAGRPTPWSGGLLRFAQDCRASYGAAVRAFAITELDPRRFRETEIGPILGAGAAPWHGRGMHHVDPLPVAGGWLAAVDGRAAARADGSPFP